MTRIDPLEFQVAQLRHAYKQLVAETVKNQKEFAEGLLAPAIRLLEDMLAEQKLRSGIRTKFNGARVLTHEEVLEILASGFVPEKVVRLIDEISYTPYAVFEWNGERVCAAYELTRLSQ